MKMKLGFILIVLLGSLTANSRPDSDSLYTELIKAQIKNQKAQAESYPKERSSINPAWIGVIGALAGSIIGLLGGILTTRIATKQELERVKKIAAADLIKKTAEGFQSLTWILWIARHTPNEFKMSDIESHDKKMNDLYPQIAGAQIVLIAYSKELHTATKPIVEYLYAIDHNVAKIALGVRKEETSNKSIEELGLLWSTVYSYSETIPEKFAKSLKIDLPLRPRSES